MDQQQKGYNTLDKSGSAKADELHHLFHGHCIDFATGVPCGVLRHIIENINQDSTMMHVPANRESEAIGIAAGAHFAGKRVLVYMQNLGLFAASNDIASLLIPYRIPLFIVVTFRGCEGEDAVQHFVTGHSTCSLLTSFGLPFAVYDGSCIKNIAQDLFQKMEDSSLPTVLLFKRGWQR